MSLYSLLKNLSLQDHLQSRTASPVYVYLKNLSCPSSIILTTRFLNEFLSSGIYHCIISHFDVSSSTHFLEQTTYTLIRKSPRWCVFTQAWGYIVITSYLGAFLHVLKVQNLAQSLTKTFYVSWGLFITVCWTKCIELDTST